MDMIEINLSHGMAKDFQRRFRDTFFIIDKEDKRNVEQYLQSIGTSFDERLLEKPEYILSRVKRYIPPPEELVPALTLLFEKYGPSKCASSKLPLFDKRANDTASRIIESARLGHISDLVDGPTLYIVKGFDKNNLPLYRCCRGTSSVEGSVHMNIIRKFASYSAGPRFSHAILDDYRLYHNLDMGSRNRYGQVYTSHYCPWLSESINLLRIEVGHRPIPDYFYHRLSSSYENQQTK